MTIIVIIIVMTAFCFRGYLFLFSVTLLLCCTRVYCGEPWGSVSIGVTGV